jgi:hypothetical protein
MENLLIELSNLDFADFSEFVRDHEFKGFDARKYLDVVSNDPPKSTMSIAVLGAMQGGNWSKYRQSDVKVLQDLSYIQDVKKNKATGKTVLRTTSVLAPEVACILFQNQKSLQLRYDHNKLPVFLQFPGAAAIRMNQKLRIEHIAFCKAFSALLPKGQFNENIYNSMASNAREMPKNAPEELVKLLA